MQFTSTQKRAAAWLLIAALFVLVLWALGPVLTPFVVAAVLAYALTPLVNWLDNLGRGRLPRVVAVLVVELLFIVALLGVVLLIVPILAKEMPLLREQVPVLFDKLNTWLQLLLAQLESVRLATAGAPCIPPPSNGSRLALEACQTTCERGHFADCGLLAQIYSSGMGVDADKEKAKTYYQKSCDGGEMWACNNLAYLYESGGHALTELARAVALYHQACSGGLLAACANGQAASLPDQIRVSSVSGSSHLPGR